MDAAGADEMCSLIKLQSKGQQLLKPEIINEVLLHQHSAQTPTSMMSWLLQGGSHGALMVRYSGSSAPGSSSGRGVIALCLGQDALLLLTGPLSTQVYK